MESIFQRNDWIVGLVSILLGIIIVIPSLNWDRPSMDPAGPWALPNLLAAAMIIIGVIHLIGAFFWAKRSESSFTAGEVITLYEELKPIMQITLVCVVYIAFLRILGYLIMTPLLIIGILWVVNERNIKVLLQSGIITTIVLYVIFVMGLKVNLPIGFLEVFF